MVTEWVATNLEFKDAALAALLTFALSIGYAYQKGTLVSGSASNENLDRLTLLWEARLDESHERENQWREAHGRSEEARNLLTQQNDKLLVYAEATDRFIRSLKPDQVA
jgi:hypothetical protein